MNRISKYFPVIIGAFVLLFTTLVAGCSKDTNDNPAPGNGTIDAAVGTYKGKLSSSDLDEFEHFNAVLIVSKVDNQHVKMVAKSAEAYSSVTEKVFKLEHKAGGDVRSADRNLEGYFWYAADGKILDVGTSRQDDGDIGYQFKGVKQ